MSDIEERVGRLEEHHAEKMVHLGVLDAQLKEIEVKLDGLTKTLNLVRDTVLTMKICPSPGLCLELQKQLAEQKAEIVETRKIASDLQTDKLVFQRGKAGVLNIAGAVLLFGTVSYWTYYVIEFFIHNKHP